jgi:hypothetical protein
MTQSIFGAKGTTKPHAGTQAHPQGRVSTRKDDEDHTSQPNPVGKKIIAENLVEHLTLEQIRLAVPPHLINSVTQEMVDDLNSLATDPLLGSAIRENFLGYTKVMAEGRFKIEDYISAVKYVTYKLMGYSNEEAYSRAFPNRYQILLDRNTSKKDISSHVSAYHKNKLVSLIMENALMPTWVLNQDMFQKALSVQYEIMNDQTMGGKVRVEAANSLLTHLAKPKEANKFQINVGVEHSGMKEMREMMEKMAQQQQGLIVEGKATTVELADAELVSSGGPRDKRLVPKKAEE